MKYEYEELAIRKDRENESDELGDEANNKSEQEENTMEKDKETILFNKKQTL